MNQLRAIETTYNCYRFRSRLEARWALFFDAIGAKWAYEQEGFELPSGRYLPDFLFENSWWIEVKAEPPNDREKAVASDLAMLSLRPVLIVVGDPMNGKNWLYLPDLNCTLENIGFAECRRCAGEIWWYFSDEAYGPVKSRPECTSERFPVESVMIDNAMSIARGARFEWQ